MTVVERTEVVQVKFLTASGKNPRGEAKALSLAHHADSPRRVCLLRTRIGARTPGVEGPPITVPFCYGLEEAMCNSGSTDVVRINKQQLQLEAAPVHLQGLACHQLAGGRVTARVPMLGGLQEPHTCPGIIRKTRGRSAPPARPGNTSTNGRTAARVTVQPSKQAHPCRHRVGSERAREQHLWVTRILSLGRVAWSDATRRDTAARYPSRPPPAPQRRQGAGSSGPPGNTD